MVKVGVAGAQAAFGQSAQAGLILPPGIATDDTTKYFFQNIVDNKSLVSIYSFENEAKVFPNVDHRVRFALLTMTGKHNKANIADFVFGIYRTDDLKLAERHFSLTADEVKLLNPNTRTCPIFRSKRDAELTKAIYRHVPILIKDGSPEENPWNIKFTAMFHMANDSGLFRTYEQLTDEGWDLKGNKFVKSGQIYLPLYEAKLIHQYDHRWATYNGIEARDITSMEKRDPFALVNPRYWVLTEEVSSKLKNWKYDWVIGFRSISRTTDQRTMIVNIFPKTAVSGKLPLFCPTIANIALTAAFVGCLNSYALDYFVRQKVGGTDIAMHYVKQFPVLPPLLFHKNASWTGSQNLCDWIKMRVLELTYTAWDLQPFAQDCGYNGPPFAWDEQRRFQLRCELDAAYFHLYGIARDDVDYIMDTFPIVRRKDEQQHGEYRTKRVILELYDRMAAGEAVTLTAGTAGSQKPG